MYIEKWYLLYTLDCRNKQYKWKSTEGEEGWVALKMEGCDWLKFN
jgi:hypothetical protein